ncbi:hypothetical protein SCD_n00112 [Sulfuricella denitrificans skB26]|uniref:Teneurin-like YD-shell domain-containing protein n=1 Tax=Sulfuricella denitrificans (strain DSM 22764 / NBRC 105220 / skB26) TaxID=1163617 RepID=S6AE24_SULDS|nr:RHS repeat-associated core domain-containing protein [Sulfuricella denitrificans]BAN33961.1 hypothetical protein SCD_n00112 [Sulfuricella denitrificans skB26]
MLKHTRLIAPLLAGLLLLGQTTAQAETASLVHDDFGNITQRTVNPGTTGQATTTYGYDALNRLNTEAGPAQTQTISYDADGNRLSDGSGNYTYDPNSNKMLTTRQGVSVSTDPSGRITSDGTGRTYTYNQAGQLYTISKNSVLMATYYYNAQSQRTRKVTTASAPQGAQTVVYHYDQQGHLLAETSGTGTPIRTYVWRDDTPIAQIEHQPTRKTLYYEVDHLNTPRAAMDETGKVLWRWESDAFGSTLANEDADGDNTKVTVNLRFPGQYYDAESGLNYNYARNYDSSTGRYTTSDPIGLDGGINTYSYVENNPLNYFDPDGLLITSTIGGLQNGMTISQATAIGSMGNAAMAAGGVGGVTTVVSGAAGGGYIAVPKAARIAVGVAKATIKGALSKTPGLPPPKHPVYPQCTPPAISTPALPSSVPPPIPLTLQFPK